MERKFPNLIKAENKHNSKEKGRKTKAKNIQNINLNPSQKIFQALN